jgi:hypothetical protein
MPRPPPRSGARACGPPLRIPGCHDAVVEAAWMARGVVDVDDELQITG